MLTVAREFTFDSAHRLFGYNGKCANIHGHEYKLVVEFTTLKAKKLDEVGMIVDFGVIKRVITKYLEEWDHVIILNHIDPLVEYLEKEVKVKILHCNPTVENMIQIIAHDLMHLTYSLKQIENIDIVLQSITLYETNICYARYDNFHENAHKDLWSCDDNKG